MEHTIFTIIAAVVAYILGAVVSWFILNPSKAWDEGWEAAKKYYENWGKGFDDGWNGALKAVGDLADAHKESYKERGKNVGGNS